MSATMPRCCGSRTHWIWDSWIADDGERYHLFFLKAPRALEDPALRHAAATIGHATLARPRRLGRARGRAAARRRAAGTTSRCGPARSRAATTASGGCTTRRSPATARPRRHGPAASALAESDDLIHVAARRRPAAGRARPALVPHARRHRRSETWRDPFVFRDPDGDGWHMLITARDPDAPRLRDGVLAHARSADMRDLGAPAAADRAGRLRPDRGPAGARRSTGAACSSFTCHPEEQSAEQIERFGPFTHVVRARRLARSARGTSAAARPFERRAGAVRRAARPAAATARGRSSASATRSRRGSCRSRSSTRSRSGSATARFRACSRGRPGTPAGRRSPRAASSSS